LQEAFHLAWAQRGVGFRADMRLTNEDWLEEARRITAPFLCLHGAESRTVSRNAVEKLAQTFSSLHDSGVKVLLSNSDTPEVRKIFKDFVVETVFARRSINSKGSGRGVVAEVLVRNY
jgi:pimeloyl-ACP methyl ester carboxylesterase